MRCSSRVHQVGEAAADRFVKSGAAHAHRKGTGWATGPVGLGCLDWAAPQAKPFFCIYGTRKFPTPQAMASAAWGPATPMAVKEVSSSILVTWLGGVPDLDCDGVVYSGSRRPIRLDNCRNRWA